MRKIKFRAWDKKEKSLGPPIKLQNIHMCLMKRELRNLVWMQFTGLKDKNKKEIYEGDILKVESYGGKEIVEVKFEGDYAGWDFYIGEDLFPLTDYKDMMGFKLNAKVIGNIYENSELLNSTHKTSSMKK